MRIQRSQDEVRSRTTVPLPDSQDSPRDVLAFFCSDEIAESANLARAPLQTADFAPATLAGMPVLRELGRGGAPVVYAVQTDADGPVAVKVSRFPGEDLISRSVPIREGNLRPPLTVQADFSEELQHELKVRPSAAEIATRLPQVSLEPRALRNWRLTIERQRGWL